MGQRLLWADAAKGVTIVLVVLHHLTTKHYDLILPDQLGALDAFWGAVSSALKPLRMPLFFVLSGFFAAGAIRRPWRDVARKRLATPYWVYVVWLLLQAAIFSIATTLPMNRTRNLDELASDLLVASTGVWYLYALVVYFAAAKVLERFDTRFVLAVAAGVSGSASLLPIEAANQTSLVQHFFFFAVGAYLPELVRRLGAMRGWHLFPVLVSTYLLANAMLHWAGVPQSIITLVLSSVALPLAIKAIVDACSVPQFAETAAFVGRRTLPVYVLHVPVIALLHHLSPTDLGAGGPVLSWAVAAVYPVLGTLVVTGTSLAIYKGLTGLGFGWLFRLPDTGGIRRRDDADSSVAAQSGADEGRDRDRDRDRERERERDHRVTTSA